MLFSPDMIEAIRAGRKTQTRRPVKDNEYRGPATVYIELDVESGQSRVKWQVGRIYSAQPGRGKHAVCRIRIVGIEREYLNEISAADAKAEGFNGRDEFFFKWRLLYGATADITAPVWVLTFEVVS